MKTIFISLLILISLQNSFGQVTSEKNKERDELKNAKLYFLENDKCKNLIGENSLEKAEITCNTAILIANKLPQNRYLEKRSAYIYLSIVQIRNVKAKEALGNLEKALAVAEGKLTDNDSETGETYFLIGQANHSLGNVKKAVEFYNKAEKSYRKAFEIIDAEELRGFYPKAIKQILQSHLALLENSDLPDDASKLRQIIEIFEKDFANYL